MKRFLLAAILSCGCIITANAQEIAKTGLNFGPLPAVGYSSDLGWHYGLYDDRNDMTIPVDILRELSQRYDVEVKVLYQAYVDGMSQGLAERKERPRYRPDTSGILGTPRDLAQNAKEGQNS